MRMFNPPHPGEILAELWLAPLNLTITQTAKNLNVTRKTVSALVNGKTGSWARRILIPSALSKWNAAPMPSIRFFSKPLSFNKARW